MDCSSRFHGLDDGNHVEKSLLPIYHLLHQVTSQNVCMQGMDNGYAAEMKVPLRWQLSRDPVSNAWLIDSVEIANLFSPE